MLKVLIVDDNEDDRVYFSHLITKVFPEERVNISLAEDGHSALKCFQTSLPDLVFLDQNLPDQNGLEVLAQLRAISENPYFIFLTGYENNALATRAIESGASDYLDKNRLSTYGIRRALRNAKVFRQQMEVIDAQKQKLEEENQKLNEREQNLARSLKRIEAQNARISLELEEARKIQMNMLPQQFPLAHNCRLLTFMETATEVGGDYYDWVIRNKDDMIFTIGDVTGHGLKAGIVVATVKSFFQSLGDQLRAEAMIERISEGIRGLGIRHMYMGLSVFELKDQQLTISAGGMPPCLYYNAMLKQWQAIRLAGMYLGTNFDLATPSLSFEVNKGDIVLAFTDGLTEMFNHEKEQLGSKRISDAMQKLPNPNAETVMETVKSLARAWKAKGDHHDDWTILTFEVLA